jgi:TP901 family phage tail tape measure protein
MSNNLETILTIKVDGTDSMVALKTEIDKTTEELKQLKAEQKAGTGDTKKLNAEILTQETRLKSMRKEMNTAKGETIKMNTALGAQGKSYNDLTKQNAALSVQLRKLADPLGKNKKEFEELSTKMKANTDQLKKMDGAMGRNFRSVGDYGGAIKGMALQIGAAIMAFKTLERVIGTFADFQFQIKQVGVISGATAQELEALEQQAKDLGSSTAFTASEVAGLQVELAKLGFKSDEIQNMTSSVLDLSFAFGDDLGETASQVGITLRAFNLDASEASRVTDVMAAAFSNSALDLSKFATAMPKVASIASTMGFTLEDTTAILGQLANNGFEASTAGTALKNMMLKLADPTGDLAQALGRNVTSVDELVPAMQELQKKGIDVAGMLELTDARSVAAFASLMKGAPALKNLSKELKNSEGLTKKFADTMRNSLKGNIDATKSAAEGLVIELVDGLEPIINMLLYAFMEVLDVLRTLVPVIISLTAGFAAYGAVMLVTNTRTLLVNTAMKLFGTTTVTTTGFIKLAKNAMLAFNTAVKSNPIGLLVAGLATAVTLFSQFSDGAGEGSDELEALNDQRERFNAIDNQANSNLASQLAEVKSLISVIGDHTKSLKERNKALKDLNKIHPTTISNLQDEKNLAGQLEQAYEDIAKAMEAEILMSAAKEKVKELIVEQRDLQREINDDTKAQQRLQLDLLGVMGEINEEGNVTGLMFDKNGQLIQGNVNAIEYLADNWVASSNKMQEANGMYDDGAADHNAMVNEEIEITEKLGEKQTKLGNIKERIVKILKQATTESGALTEALTDNTDETEENLTAYEQLQKNVKDANKALREAVATNGDVSKATDDLKKAKKELGVVDTKVKEIIKKNDDELKGTVDGLQIRIDKIKETVAEEQKELDMITDLTNAGAKLAKEQIEQSIAVAEAKLELYKMDISMSDNSKETQVKNINEILTKLKGFNAELKNMSDENSDGAPAGWLNKNLFGTGGEDGSGGEGYTGANLVEDISATMGAVLDVMGSYNELQNAQSEARINTMTQEKNTEIKNFKESAQYEIMTDEERTKKIEQIEKRHDDKILAEKIKMFDKNQKFLKAQAVMAGAMAIMQIWSSSATGNAIADAIIKGIMTAAMVAMTGMQIATINAAQPPTAEQGAIINSEFLGGGKKYADGGMVHGPSHADGGVKFNVGGRVAELEGGEAVINKRSTAMFMPQLSAMNQAGGGVKFADGGLTFATDILQDQSLAMANALSNSEQQEVVMVEANVTDSQKSVENIEAQVTF